MSVYLHKPNINFERKQVTFDGITEHLDCLSIRSCDSELFPKPQKSKSILKRISEWFRNNILSPGHLVELTYWKCESSNKFNRGFDSEEKHIEVILDTKNLKKLEKICEKQVREKDYLEEKKEMYLKHLGLPSDIDLSTGIINMICKRRKALYDQLNSDNLLEKEHIKGLIDACNYLIGEYTKDKDILKIFIAEKLSQNKNIKSIDDFISDSVEEYNKMPPSRKNNYIRISNPDGKFLNYANGTARIS